MYPGIGQSRWASASPISVRPTSSIASTARKAWARTNIAMSVAT